MTSFNELGLDANILKALDAEGYTIPTPIQAQAIPHVLTGRDLLGIAQTGTGKTAAFALPILTRLAANPAAPMRRSTRVLVLSPTRELASQIADSFKTYGRFHNIKVATIYGGVGMKPQINAIAGGVDVLVATPGRLIDHIDSRTLTLDGTEVLVVDEADQMMDLGFIRPLRQIIAKIPARRQTLFFSATMPHEIGALAAELLRDPAKVSVTPVAKTADRVEQKVIFIEQQKKRALLAEMFADPVMARTLVFTRTKRGADRVARHLELAGIKVAAIHGNKSQNQREYALEAFKQSRIRALIATDIAARGIDIDQVSHVVNYELPNVPESYVHRIGRTARAGAEGIAISLVDHEERDYLRDIERLTRQTIPSSDRRGDSSLIVPVEEKSAAPAFRDARARPAGRGGRSGEGRGGERGERSGGGGGGRSGGGERGDRGGFRHRDRSGPSRHAGDRVTESRSDNAPIQSAWSPTDAKPARVVEPVRGDDQPRKFDRPRRDDARGAGDRSEPRTPRDDRGAGRGPRTERPTGSHVAGPRGPRGPRSDSAGTGKQDTDRPRNGDDRVGGKPSHVHRGRPEHRHGEHRMGQHRTGDSSGGERAPRHHDDRGPHEHRGPRNEARGPAPSGSGARPHEPRRPAAAANHAAGEGRSRNSGDQSLSRVGFMQRPNGGAPRGAANRDHGGAKRSERPAHAGAGKPHGGGRPHRSGGEGRPHGHSGSSGRRDRAE